MNRLKSRKSLITIIMPAYNAEKYIGAAIQSVIDQDYPNWELLIINDGSTDKTEEIIRQFSDKRIKYFHQDNKGVSSARNVGLERMSGDLFCFLDSDDKLTENSISSRVPLFEEKSVCFVDGLVCSYNEDMTRQLSVFRPNFRGDPLPQLLKLSSSCFFGITWMIRRSNGFNYGFSERMKYAEDLWFYIELARQGGDYAYVEIPIYERREVGGSAMSNLTELAKGYWVLYQTIKQNDLINPGELSRLKKKIQFILLKSGIRRIKPGVLRHLFPVYL